MIPAIVASDRVPSLRTNNKGIFIQCRVVTNPFCEQCDEAIESAMHYLCYCSSFSSIRRAIWGKDILYPADIEAISVRGLVRLIKESRRFSQSC